MAFEIANLALTTLLGIYLVFFKSYFSEKGKNLATQEDIGEITKVVEGIRTDLTNDTEMLKSKLSLINQNKFSLKTTEREAIFELNKAFASWISSLMRFSFTGYEDIGKEESMKIFSDFKKETLRLDLAESQLHLFMTDKQLILLTRDLKVLIIEMEALIIKSIMKYSYEYKMYNIQSNNRTSENYSQLYSELSKKLSEITSQSAKEKVESYRKVVAKQAGLTQLMKSRLAVIEEQ